MSTPNQSFRQFEHAGWENAGVVTAYHENLSSVTTQSIAPLLDAAGVAAGSRVLDVATGAGYVAGAAAQRGADAIGVDFSSAQIRMARRLYPAVRFEEADAESLPFESGSFDAVVNAYGMCHFPHPDAALREAFRVLKPGGRVAFTVWDLPERAVGLGAVYAAVRTHGSMDVGLPVGPNFFLFSEPEQSIQGLRDAGFESPSCPRLPQVWRITDPEQLFETVTHGTVRAAATLEAQSPRAKEAIRTALREVVTAYRRGPYFEVPMPALLATAVKPGL